MSSEWAQKRDREAEVYSESESAQWELPGAPWPSAGNVALTAHKAYVVGYDKGRASVVSELKRMAVYCPEIAHALALLDKLGVK